jgi:3-oxoacid CoA-transferase subunit A
VQKKYPNIHYVKDAGDVYTFGEYNFLIIPGAYSVDKYYRLRNNYPYEMEELLTASEMEQILKYTNDFKNDIDFVLAHTAPMKIEPKLWYLFMNGVNQDEVDKTMENWLDDVMNVIEDGNNFKQYFFGHFHDDKKLDENYTMLYHCVEKLDDYIEKGE